MTDSALQRAPGRFVFALHGVAVGLGAFLLFQVQPMVGKAILPWFGGGAQVWTTCLLFFQSALLLGYLYAHLLCRHLSARRTAVMHGLLLLAALALQPILPSPAWKPAGPDHPALRILTLLGANIGLPYLVLSATSPLVMHWLALDFPAARPFRFYALSNLGSLVALGSYPLLVEPRLSLPAQSRVWSALFLGYALVVAFLALRRARRPAAQMTIQPPSAPSAVGPLRAASVGTWLTLAALPSALLLAVTTHLSVNIAPIPFLWVLPLGLYLLSFILAFDHPRWYRRPLMLFLFFPALFLMAFYASEQQQLASVWKTIPLYGACFFAVCFLLNGELAALKPDKRELTGYYLVIAAGGALGGIAVGVAAPLVFSAHYDLLFLLIAVAFVPFLTLRHSATGILQRSWARVSLAAAAGITAVVTGYVLYQKFEMTWESRRATRNFYGTLRVLDEGRGEERYRSLIDGVIDHGCQFLDPSRQDWLTTYYGPGSGASLAFRSLPARPCKVGLLGLGAGTLAAHGRPGDRYDFIEINPDVVRTARKDFTFLARSRAEVRVLLGDGRRVLEDLPDQGYDLLVLDVFSSDAIPVHLLTREAFLTYFRHLRPDGLLCVNISNRYLDLVPVLRGAAESFGKEGWLVLASGDSSIHGAASRMVVLAAPGRAQGIASTFRAAKPLLDLSGRVDWSDERLDLISLLKVRKRASGGA